HRPRDTSGALPRQPRPPAPRSAGERLDDALEAPRRVAQAALAVALEPERALALDELAELTPELGPLRPRQRRERAGVCQGCLGDAEPAGEAREISRPGELVQREVCPGRVRSRGGERQRAGAGPGERR